MRRVLVTGSRNWVWQTPVWNAILMSGPDVVVHGGARGADRYAATCAQHHGLAVEEYPADWDRFGKAAGAIRNQQMLDTGITVCLAFPLPDSRGTRDMMRRCDLADVEVLVYNSTYGMMIPFSEWKLSVSAP